MPLDPVLMERAIANLLENALRFTPHGGTVEVRSTAEDGTTFSIRWPKS